VICAVTVLGALVSGMLALLCLLLVSAAIVLLEQRAGAPAAAPA
jgi:hypothetical protein